ncbi:undecaprenyl-diphosphate phosphatase [Candidatus Pacearchaeota archaeon]|nr:undecaprenyl-diphosphate phosphatase [Candidatus Pacearchaeota archaeon]
MELTIIQQLILGIVQGITEWLPVSSSAFLTLIMANFFGITNIGVLIETALFFHIGTFFAALIYFRKDVYALIKTLFKFKKASPENQEIFKFLLIATIISGIVGLGILIGLKNFQDQLVITGKTITFAIGLLLLFTGILQLKAKSKGLRKEREIKNKDSILLGFVQGVSALPGISRSGITVSTLLLKKFDDTTALRLSFLLSLPIILLGNLFLNVGDVVFSSTAIFGILASFVFGLLTIAILMKLSKKINFGWFVLIFAILMMVSVLI